MSPGVFLKCFFTTEFTEITEKNVSKTSVDSVFSVVNALNFTLSLISPRQTYFSSSQPCSSTDIKISVAEIKPIKEPCSSAIGR